MKLIKDFYIVEWTDEEIKKYSECYKINVFVTFRTYEDIRKICLEKSNKRDILSQFWKYILENSGFLIDPYPFIPVGIWKTRTDNEIWDFCKVMFKELIGKSIVRYSSRLKEPDELINVINKQNFEQLLKELK
jgi:hypothetical protein